MIAIGNILISDEVVSEQFVCDLSRCKGGCCEDGDAGAPLTDEELDIIREVYDKVEPYLTDAGKAELARQGKYRYDREFGWVTPTVDGGICAYGYRDEKGIIMCAFEQAYHNGETRWKKPISCHLYPIKVSVSRHSGLEMVNYEPRETLCAPACSLGKKLRVPVYQFLKEPLIRKFGEEFHEALSQVASEYFEASNASKK